MELPEPPNDALQVRFAGPWTKEKLRIVHCYLSAFVKASEKKAKGSQYVDAFAGPGVNVIRETGERVPGSPLLAIIAGFTGYALVEKDEETAAALKLRVQRLMPAAGVWQGDCNIDLPLLVEKHLDPWLPSICVLDPEGSELNWQTIERLSKFKNGKTKAEQLVLFPTDTGFVRLLFLQRDIEPWAELKISTMFGNDDWRPIYQARKRQDLTADEARTKYVKLYAAGFKALGYHHVLDRLIRTSDGRPLYFLLFATDHDAGLRIMDHCFDRIWPEDDGQLSFFTKVDRRKRVDEADG